MASMRTKSVEDHLKGTISSLSRMLLGFAVLLHLATIIAVSAQTFRDTVYVNEGEQFTLPCKNETPGMYIGIVWKERETQLYTRLRPYGVNIHDRIYKRSRLVKETSLQIDNASADDSGVYKCGLVYKPKKLKFPHAVIPSLIKVIVSVKPNITLLNPAMQYRSAGQEAYIKCSFKAVPSANVTWRFDGRRDVTGRYTTYGNTSVLQLRKVRRKDTGYYTCSAANRAGTDEGRAYIKVMYAPRIVYITPRPHIDVGKNGTITCKARGYPLPSMYWNFKKGLVVVHLKAGEDFDRKFSVSATKQDRLEEWSESVLTINSAEVEDWQVNFTCIAANNEGARYEFVNVKGATRPERPDITVEPISPRKVQLNWSVTWDGGSKILEYTLQYALKYKNGTEQGWTSKYIRPGNLSSFQLVGLKPSARYLFRISARNYAGSSDFSDTIIVVTHGEKRRNQGGKDGTVIPNKQGSKAPGSSENGIIGDLGLAGVIGIAGGVLLMIFICIAVICLVSRQKPSSSQTTSVFGSRPVSIDNGSSVPTEGRRPSEMPSETTEFIPLLARTDHWEFPRDRLRLSTLLGSGAFGTVMRGDAQGIRGSPGSVKVAVKIAKDDDNGNATRDLHAELGVLKLLPEHPNVVGLLGCCTRSEPLMIIVEYCAHGDLQGFLRSSRGISESYYRSKYHPIGRKMTSKMLLTFALQIAKGMSHLAAFKIIHRDLAARNVLVNEDLVCKISDFGFARDIYVEDQYMKKSKGGRFPIKWMALESLLDGISTPKSDVWAFGVVLWEIVTLGASPYPGMNSYEVVSFLQDGLRMDKPKHCSDELYALSMTCWNVAPQRRPTFEELASTLMEMLGEDKEFINMNFYQDHLYENFDVNLACQSSAHGSGIELNSSEATPLRLTTFDNTIAISS